MKTEYTVMETNNGYEVAMLHNERIVQIVIRTDNRQKAYRIAEKFNGKRRATERKNKSIMFNTH
jgi:capsular polysaccharide biosynthesis protein